MLDNFFLIFLATSYLVTKKLGAASIQEELTRNKEYFANLQRCYNPSVEFCDFTRSHSSNEVLGQSKIQEYKVQSSDSSSKRLLKRSHTCSVLSLNKQSQVNKGGQSVSTFSKIIEKRRRGSLIEDTEKDGEENIVLESFREGEDDEDMERTQSIQKVRGILEGKFKTDYAMLNNIKFRLLEENDKFGHQREFPRITKRILRSPTTRDFYLLRSRVPTPIFPSPPPKSKAHFCFCTNVSSQRLTSECDSFKYKLKQNNQNYESSINDSDKAKKVLGLLPKYLDSPKLSSPQPEHVELSYLELKAIQNRSFSRYLFVEQNTQISLPTYPKYPTNVFLGQQPTTHSLCRLTTE